MQAPMRQRTDERWNAKTIWGKNSSLAEIEGNSLFSFPPALLSAWPNERSTAKF
jgi:hypothetical protein